jgi:hypothetical protein
MEGVSVEANRGRFPSLARSGSFDGREVSPLRAARAHVAGPETAFGTSKRRNKSLTAGLNPVLLRSCVVSWERPFDQPVPLPNGPPARTLRDAANYIKKLPKSEHDTPEWRLAIQMLIDAAEDRGPMLFAKMGIFRAVNRNLERTVNPSRKDPHWGRRKLKRDR